MNKIELNQATAPLAQYARALDREPLVVTVNGKPKYALLDLDGVEAADLTAEAKQRLTALREEEPRPEGEAPTERAGRSPEVSVYTDGGAIGNPGPGGYGAVIIRDGERTELAGGYRRTTNNRMEIMGAIAALEALDAPSRVTIYTDSQYLANAMSKGWARRWRANGWMRNAKEPALNPDLWERLLRLAEHHRVRFEWVRGHAGHPQNERSHQLSIKAAQSPNLPRDGGYEGGGKA